MRVVPNKRVNLTNHGPDSKLHAEACVAVVCRLRAMRWADVHRVAGGVG